jgi:pyridoxamine 5'-phosphate oxidase
MTPTPPRREYTHAALDEARVAADPIDQFAAWYNEALAAGLFEPHAMCLATATPDGRPSNRIVLLRSFGPDGFRFFTNYQSRKALDLAANPRAALVFYWDRLDRQVRIEGTIEPVSPAESDDYFRTRPHGAQLAAWAALQSEPIPDRASLEAAVAELERRFGADVPRPPHWGGYRVVPELIEFWQGRPNRLHDRLRYRRNPRGGWLLDRLAP